MQIISITLSSSQAAPTIDQILNKGSAFDLYVKPEMNLYEEEKNVACKRENVHTGVVLTTYILMLKLESERV